MGSKEVATCFFSKKKVKDIDKRSFLIHQMGIREVEAPQLWCQVLWVPLQRYSGDIEIYLSNLSMSNSRDCFGIEALQTKMGAVA